VTTSFLPRLARIGGLLAAGLAAGCAAQARPVFRGDPPIPRRTAVGGVCIGSDERQLFYHDDDQQMIARSIDDGRILWREPDRGELIHCDDRRVVTSEVEGSTLRLTLRNTARGQLVQRASFTPFPSWAGERSVSVEAWAEPDGVGLAWSARTYWTGGYPPSEKEARDAEHHASGAFVLRPGGDTRSVSGAPSYERRLARRPASLRDAGESSFALGPVRIGRQAAAVERNVKGGVLHRWSLDDLSEWPTRVLGSNRTSYFESWDGRYVYFVEGEPARTHVVDLRSGFELMTAPPLSGSAGPLYVTSQRLLVALQWGGEPSNAEEDDDRVRRVLTCQVLEPGGGVRWRGPLRSYREERGGPP
jgi:hypothetical protein